MRGFSRNSAKYVHGARRVIGDDATGPEADASASEENSANQVESRLRVREAQLRAVLESVNECFYALDSEWRFTVFNRASEEYFGVSRDVILGRNLWDVFKQGLGTEYERCVRMAMDQRVSTNLVSPSLFRPGRFGDLRVAPMDGGGIAVSITDITEQKLAEDRLRQSEHELQVLTDALPVLISYVDSDQRYRFANKTYEQWFGRRREEILGLHVQEVVGEQAYALARPKIERALAGERFSDEAFMPYKDAGAREVCMDYVPRTAADGRTEGYYVLVQDITVRKQAEHALTALTETLEERVKNATADRDRLWNNARDLLLVIDTNGIFRAANPAWIATLGRRPDELENRNFIELIHPDDRPASEQAFAIAAERELLPFECRWLHKDGTYRTIAWVAVPEDDLIYASGRDVTEDKAHQAELETAREQLSEMQKMDTIGQLSGGIAHDFNNLLTPIVGSLDMLHRKYQDDERTVRMLSGALQAADRARVLVSRLLTFARRQHLEAQVIDVGSLVSDMVDLIQRTIGPQIDVVLDIKDDIPPAVVDPHQLELALLNMCVNARDAMPQGGRLTIANDCVEGHDEAQPQLPDGEFVRLCVIDTGHGMDDETRRRATEPFYSTKGVGRGTGLGLSMVHGLAIQSGGGLHINSKPGDGTTVTVWLPIAKQQPVNLGDGPQFEAITASRSLSVLLVDDEDLVLAGNSDMLESLGHRVERASSAAAALARIEAGAEFDLMLTDHMMPNMTGLDLIAAAKQLRSDLPSALVTGYAGESRLDDDVARLTKPFRLADLARFLERFTASR